MVKCSICGEEKPQSSLERIDENLVCHRCFFNANQPYRVFPIGFIENSLTLSDKLELKGDIDQISKVQLFSSQKPFLYKLSEEKHIVIVFYFHIQRPIHTKTHRRLDHKEVGIYASRTPDRPSRIGITEVELIKINGTTLFVKGLDAINESPVLDIKLGGLSHK